MAKGVDGLHIENAFDWSPVDDRAPPPSSLPGTPTTASYEGVACREAQFCIREARWQVD
jgi:hypothetical protein